MEQKFKIWEMALMAGLLVGFLSSPAGGMTTPLSRWQTGESRIRYQVNIFPFGFAPVEETTMVQLSQGETEYEIGFQILEWWEGVFG